MSDKYDKAQAWLLAQPNFHDAIAVAWHYNEEGEQSPGHCLFQYVSLSGTPVDVGDHAFCGCLTQIAGGNHVATTEALTTAIRLDKRIPTGVRNIKQEDLPVFAEWQRRIDKELERCKMSL